MTSVSSARRQWAEGRERFVEESRDASHAEALHRQRDAVLEELNRRVGSVFTLAELAAVYDGAEPWLLQVVGKRAPTAGWARTVAVAGDAAFYAYSRGAQDYTP